MITVLNVGMSDAIVKKRWLGVIFKQGCKKVKSHDLADFLFKINNKNKFVSFYFLFVSTCVFYLPLSKSRIPDQTTSCLRWSGSVSAGSQGGSCARPVSSSMPTTSRSPPVLILTSSTAS